MPLFCVRIASCHQSESSALGPPSEDAALSSDAQLQAILLRQRRRAVPCTFLACLLRHCAGAAGRADALLASLWACYGEEIETLWFC